MFKQKIYSVSHDRLSIASDNILSIDNCVKYLLSLVSDNNNTAELAIVLYELDIDALVTIMAKVFILKDVSHLNLIQIGFNIFIFLSILNNQPQN